MVGGGQRGRTKSGKVLGTEAEWGTISSSFLPPLPVKEVSAETPEEDLCSRLWIKRPRNEGARARKADM